MKNNQNQKKWEKELHKRFCITANCNLNNPAKSHNLAGVEYSEVFNFIKNLLARQKEEIIEKVKNHLKLI